MSTGNIREIQGGRRPETGSALSPLLFIAVVEVISRKTSTRNIFRKLLYADDLAAVADSEPNLQERLVFSVLSECVEERGRVDGRHISISKAKKKGV